MDIAKITDDLYLDAYAVLHVRNVDRGCEISMAHYDNKLFVAGVRAEEVIAKLEAVHKKNSADFDAKYLGKE